MSRRAADGRWQPPLILTHFGSSVRDHELAITPGGDGLVVYGDNGGNARIRAILLPANGSPHVVNIGRGVPEGVVTSDNGHVRVLWSRFGRHDRLVSRVVTLATGHVAAPHTAVPGCFGEIDQYRSDVLAGDARGRLAMILVCGEHQRPAVTRLPAP
jgi:hypothetical protein